MHRAMSNRVRSGQVQDCVRCGLLTANRKRLCGWCLRGVKRKSPRPQESKVERTPGEMAAWEAHLEAEAARIQREERISPEDVIARSKGKKSGLKVLRGVCTRGELKKAREG